MPPSARALPDYTGPITDIATHIIPTRVWDRLKSIPGCPPEIVPTRHIASKGLYDMDARVRGIEALQRPAYRQVLSYYSIHPALETFADANAAADFCRFANEAMRETINAHPDCFAQGFGWLPFHSLHAAEVEIAHVRQLGLVGVQIPTDVGGRAIDDPELLAIVEAAICSGLPLFMHPTRGADVPDFAAEQVSELGIWMVFGWPYATTAAMVRLAASGLLDRHPDATIVTHHLGGVTPYLFSRAQVIYGEQRAVSGSDETSSATQTLDQYLDRFHADTATLGNPNTLRSGLDLFGSDRVVFGTDSGPDFTDTGNRFIEPTLQVIDDERLAADQLQQVLHGNAARMLAL